MAFPACWSMQATRKTCAKRFRFFSVIQFQPIALRGVHWQSSKSVSQLIGAPLKQKLFTVAVLPVTTRRRANEGAIDYYRLPTKMAFYHRLCSVRNRMSELYSP